MDTKTVSFLLKNFDLEVILKLYLELEKLDPVTRVLKEDKWMIYTRIYLFDDVVDLFSTLANHLSTSAENILDNCFETAIVKIQ